MGGLIMTGIDASIPLGVKTPDTMTTLGNVFSTANAVNQFKIGQQSLESNEMNLQAQRQDTQEWQNLMPVMKQLIQPDGTIRTDAAAQQMILNAAPKNGLKAIQHANETNSTTAKANSDLMALGSQGIAAVGKALEPVVGGNLSDAGEVLHQLKKDIPQTSSYVDQALEQLNHAANSVGTDPVKQKGAVNAIMTHLTQRVMAIGEQQNFTALHPFGSGDVLRQSTTGNPTVPQGGVIAPVGVAPSYMTDAAGNLHQVPAISPQQPTAAGSNPVSPTDHLKPQLPGASKPAGQGWVNRPAATAQVGTAESVNKDWESNLQENTKAAQDIGVLQAIKQYSHGAITGVASDRAALVSGMAGYLGMTDAQLAKTNTDLLAKNEKMLALAGGNTNLAKTLAESANPHSTMTEEAINHASDQVIAQKQMPLIRQQYLTQFKNNPDVYAQKASEFNSVADPRILQWDVMTSDEKQAMKSSMSPVERIQFSQKMRKFDSLVGTQQ